MRLLLAAAVALLLPIAAAAWVRLTPNDAAIWHVDPLEVTTRGARNSFLLAAGGDAPAQRLALAPGAVVARLDAIALSTPRTQRLAGQGGWVTYVTRSAVWGFPDFTSVRISPADNGSDISIFARSRFGESDVGVNRARVMAWLAQLSS